MPFPGLKSSHSVRDEPHAKTNQANRTTDQRRVTFLNRCLVRDRRNSLGAVVRRGDCPGLSRHGGLSLKLDRLALCLCLPLQLGVRLDSAQEIVSGPRWRDVLNPDVDALLEVAVLDLLVDDDADRALRDVVDNTGLAVVDLVRHAVGNRGLASRSK